MLTMVAMMLVTAPTYEIVFPDDVTAMDVSGHVPAVNMEMAHTVSIPFAGADEAAEWVIETSTEGEPVLLPVQICTGGPWGGGGPWAATIRPYECSGPMLLRPMTDEDPFVDNIPIFSVIEQDDASILISENGEPAYPYENEPRNLEGIDERFRRCCYAHPLWSPSGAVVTDDFPADHYHHSGLLWRWSRAEWDDQSTNPWELTGLYSRFEDWVERDAGSICAVLGARVGWYTGKTVDDPDGVRIAEETDWIRVWRTTGAARGIDITNELRWEEDGPPMSGAPERDKGYGGMMVRHAECPDRLICTPDGAIEGDQLALTAPWADYSGTPEGWPRQAGIAIFADPSHPGWPVEWFLRQYGCGGVRWPGLAKAEVPQDGVLSVPHRVWVHDGDAWQGSTPLAYASWRWTSGVRLREVR